MRAVARAQQPPEPGLRAPLVLQRAVQARQSQDCPSPQLSHLPNRIPNKALVSLGSDSGQCRPFRASQGPGRPQVRTWEGGVSLREWLPWGTLTLLPSQTPGESPTATGSPSLDSSPWPLLRPWRVRRAVVAWTLPGWVKGTLCCISSERPSAGPVPVHAPAPVRAAGMVASLGVCPGCRRPGLHSRPSPETAGQPNNMGPGWEQPTSAALPLPLATQGDPMHQPPPPAYTVHPCVSVVSLLPPCSCFMH